MELVGEILDSLIEAARKERNDVNLTGEVSHEARRNIALAVTYLEDARFRLGEYLLEKQPS